MIIVHVREATKEDEATASWGGTIGGIVNIIAYIVLINVVQSSDANTRLIISGVTLPIFTLLTSAGVAFITRSVALGRAAAFTVALMELAVAFIASILAPGQNGQLVNTIASIIPALLIAFVVGAVGAIIGRGIAMLRPNRKASVSVPVDPNAITTPKRDR